MQRVILTALLALFCIAGSRCGTLPLDQAMGAREGNVASVLLCDDSCHKGYLFYQLGEGRPAHQSFDLVMPEDLDCDRDNCVRFSVFFQGEQVYEGGIPEGKSRAQIALVDLLNHGDIRTSDDGEYLIKVKAFFEGPDGTEYSSFGWAFLRLNVIDPDYEFMGCDDPARAWKVKHGDCRLEYSTRFRTAICGCGGGA